METKPKNQLPAEQKWNAMSCKERESFFIVQGLHRMYINNNIGKRFKDLAMKSKEKLETYIIPNPIINKNTMATKTNKKRIALVNPKPNIGTGKTFYFNKNDTKINATKIHSFLNGINETEFIYTYKCMGLASHIKSIIKEYKLTKERFCEEIKINKCLYKSYVSGGRNYSLRDMASIESFVIKLQQEEISNNNKKSIIKIGN